MSKSPNTPTFDASNLLIQGLAAVRVGAAMLADSPTDQELRTALREVSSGIELVMKSIISVEHWTLLFDDPGKATREKLNTGEFKSIGFEECLARLRGVVLIELSNKQTADLGRMRLKRNRLEHLGIGDDARALRAALGGSLHALVDLLRIASEKGRVPGSDPATHRELAADLVDIDEFVDARWKELGAGPKEERVPCPNCAQAAGVVDSGVKCFFCDTHSSPEDAAVAYAELTLGTEVTNKEKYGDEWPIFHCPDCDHESLVDTTCIDESMRCLGCDGHFSRDAFVFCENCRNPFRDEDDSGELLCKECWIELVHEH